MKKGSLKDACGELLEAVAVETGTTLVADGVTVVAGGVKVDCDSAPDAGVVQPPTPITDEEKQAEVNRIAEDMASLAPLLSAAGARLSKAKDEQKAAQKAFDALHVDIDFLVIDMAGAMTGQFQRRLPFTAPTKMTEDTGIGMEIESLTTHGMSDAEVDKLVAVDIKTVGDLEQRMREDEWWMKKIKGFGETKVEKLIDALAAFRRVHPHPEPVEPVAEVVPVESAPAA